MYRYILTGKPPRGWRQTLFVQADSCDLAVKQLRDQGWTNIQLHTDEVQAAYDKAFPATGTAEQTLRGFRGGWENFLYQVLFIYQKCWLLLAMCAISFFYYSENDVFLWLRIGLFFFPIILLGLLRFTLPVAWLARRLDKALTYEVYGQWEPMLKQAQTLTQPVPEVHRHYLCAIALAGMKRLDEAETELAHIKQANVFPEWLLLFLSSLVYLIAKDFKRADQLFHQMKSLSPDNVSIILNQGMRYYLVDQDARTAASRVEAASTHEIPDLLLPHYRFLQGAVAFENNQLDEAHQYFEQAEQAANLYSGAPTTRLTLSIIRAMQALVWARQGEHAKASRAFAYARPVLEGRDSNRLLDRCRKELGVI